MLQRPDLVSSASVPDSEIPNTDRNADSNKTDKRVYGMGPENVLLLVGILPNRSDVNNVQYGGREVIDEHI